jgi:putative ABC transport system permease protein
VSFYGIKGAGLSGSDVPPQVGMVNVVDGGYLTTLGVSPRMGRSFAASDDATGADPVAIVSDRLWRRRFHDASAIDGRTLLVNGLTCHIVGVMPRDFLGLDAAVVPDVWIPWRAWSASVRGVDPANAAPTDRWLTVIARLRGDRSLAVAREAADSTMARLAADYPVSNRDVRALVATADSLRSGRLVPIALLLSLIVGVVVAVGCANVAGLLLGRAEGRRHELAMRVAIGASSWRLVRQLLTESVLLAAAAGAAALVLSIWVIGALPSLLPPMGLPLGFAFDYSSRVATTALAVASLTVFLFGLWPALSASRRGIADATRIQAGTDNGRRSISRNVVVVGQIAVTVVLLVVGALLWQSLRGLETVDVGFAKQPLLLVGVAPQTAGYDAAQSTALLRRLVAHLQSTGGIDDVTLARRVPLSPNGGGAQRDVVIRGEAPIAVKWNAVMPDYFRVMDTRLIAGRPFGNADGGDAHKVLIVNRTMAARFWPGEMPIGRRMDVGGPGGGSFEIVGVVEDGKINRLTEAPEPYMFLCWSQVPSSEATIIVRAGREPLAAAPAVRKALREIDPGLPTLEMLTLDDHMRYPLYEAHVTATITAWLGAGALSLALIGLYAVMSFDVARRRKETGIRMALGATRADIRRDVLRRALALAGTGACLGVAGGQLVRGAMASTLYGVRAWEPLTLGGVALGVVGIALIAAWWPARQAASADPVRVLNAV